MKWMKFVASLVLIIFLIASPVYAYKWYPGIVHLHSTFSDGDTSPSSLINYALNEGAAFLIVTDHYEQVDYEIMPDGRKKIGAYFGDDYGFNHYREKFSSFPLSAEGVTLPMVVIPGAEITSCWNGAMSHTLALGNLAFRDETLFGLQMKQGTQQAIINRINELGLLSVAAHPMQVTTRYKKWYGQISNFQYDPAAAKGIGGIEFFNEEDPQDYERTRNWYLSLLRQGRKIFVTAGCDSHYLLEPGNYGLLGKGDKERWQRKTWVLMCGFKEEGLLWSLKYGHTYASNGAHLEDLYPLPGFLEQRTSQTKFSFRCVFERKTTKPVSARIWRNGILAPDSVRTIPKGSQEFCYRWEDSGASLGSNTYVIEVERTIVTSPVVLDLVDSSQDYKVIFVNGRREKIPPQPGERIYFSSGKSPYRLVGKAEVVKTLNPIFWREEPWSYLTVVKFIWQEPGFDFRKDPLPSHGWGAPGWLDTPTRGGGWVNYGNDLEYFRYVGKNPDPEP